jgi:hypothetical protein
MILLQLIVFLYAISSFIYSHLLSRTCSLHLFISLHFGNIWTTFCSSLRRGIFFFLRHFFSPPSFYIPNLNHANPILSLKLHCSVHISVAHSCFIIQHETRDLFSFRLLCFWLSLDIVTSGLSYFTYIFKISPFSVKPNVFQPKRICMCA